MKNVTVIKDDLRTTIEKNRETHIADFEIAWEAYTKELVSKAESLLRKASRVKKGEDVNLYIHLDTPQSHEVDYDRALEMLDWETGNSVVLSESDFRQLVQDEWQWKRGFQAGNAFYTGSESPSTVIG